MSGIEDNIMNKKFSFTFKDVKWIITSGVAITLWIVTSIMWVRDKDAQSDKIKKLEESRSQLEKQVATLEGQIKGIENASIVFMQNPPNEIKFRLDLLEKRILILEGPNSTRVSNFIDTTNVSRRIID